MQPIQNNLTFLVGASFQYVLRWFGSQAVHKPITAVQPGWPTVITVTAHGLTSRWPVWISNVQRPSALNTPSPGGCTPLFADVMDANTLAVDVNTGAQPGPYTGAGILTSYPITDLTGYSAKLQVRSAPNSAVVLLELSTVNGGISLNPATGEITLLATALQTSAFTWQQGVYDLLLISPTGFVTRLAQGKVSVVPEVTIQ